MRRLSILFSIALVFSLVVVAAATAAAPDFCDPDSLKYNADHPTCSTTTTTTTEPPAVQPCEAGPLAVAAGSNGFVCEWTPKQDGSDGGTVAVEVASGSIGGLAIFVVDSLPGNICVLEQINKPTEHESASFPLVEGEATYWNTGGTEWCARYDEFGPKEDLNGSPLLVRVNFRAKKGAVVNISFSPADIADTQ